MTASTATEPNLQLIATADRRSEWSQAWRRFRANRFAVGGLVVILLLASLAVFAPLFSPYDPITEIFRGMRGGSPTTAHPFGYDHLGRDLLSRVIFGTRIALMVGLLATGIAVTMGVVIGAVAGYFGSWVDMLISRVIDTLMAFPIIALLVVLAAVLGPSLVTTVLVIGFTGWARFARVVRADVMSLKATDFVTAARAVGVRDWRIIWRHLLPNVMGPVIVLATLGIGGIIILESALSFLGLGIRPPNPSWGGILGGWTRLYSSLSPYCFLSRPHDRYHSTGVQFLGRRPARCTGSTGTGLARKVLEMACPERRRRQAAGRRRHRRPLAGPGPIHNRPLRQRRAGRLEDRSHHPPAAYR